MVEDYQNAAEIIVQIVNAVVVIALLAGAIAGLLFFFGKRIGRDRNADEKQNDNE